MSDHMSDDLRERVARAISRYHTIPWENMPDARKKRLLAYADAALAEMGGADLDEAVLQAAVKDVRVMLREIFARDGYMSPELKAIHDRLAHAVLRRDEGDDE